VVEEGSKPKRAATVITTSNGGRALALIPLTVAILLGALMMPRGAVPEAIPVPIADSRVLEKIAEHDRELADRAEQDPLPAEVRALGSAIRQFNTLQAKDSDAPALAEARRALDNAIAPALAMGGDKLALLRAAQVEVFLQEARAFEATGAESDELYAVGGPFVRRIRLVGWCTETNVIVLNETERRVAFKSTWNALLNLDAHPDLKISLDEMRALYTLYIQHPHAPEDVREQFELSRKSGVDERACREFAAREEAAIEGWRLDKIKKLGALDPAYPLAYAIGIAQFRRGQYGPAGEAFRAWTMQHPDGPYALRARNYLKTSLELSEF
jgi:hypothetical protein